MLQRYRFFLCLANTTMRRPRFSLKSQLLAVAFLAMALALAALVHTVVRLEAGQDVLLEHVVTTERTREERCLSRIATILAAPLRYERDVGIVSSPFGDLRHVSAVELPEVTITSVQTDRIIALLSQLPWLESVDVSRVRMTPTDLEKLKGTLNDVLFVEGGASGEFSKWAYPQLQPSLSLWGRGP